MIHERDEAEYARTKRAIVLVLKKSRRYEPAIDDIYIDEIVRSTIQSRKIEVFLHTDTATEQTHVRVADIRVKLAKIIVTAMRELAISPRDRLVNQTQATVIEQIRDAILRGSKNEEQQPDQ